MNKRQKDNERYLHTKRENHRLKRLNTIGRVSGGRPGEKKHHPIAIAQGIKDMMQQPTYKKSGIIQTFLGKIFKRRIG